jgi:hypothetical protein
LESLHATRPYGPTGQPVAPRRESALDDERVERIRRDIDL